MQPHSSASMPLPGNRGVEQERRNIANGGKKQHISRRVLGFLLYKEAGSKAKIGCGPNTPNCTQREGPR